MKKNVLFFLILTTSCSLLQPIDIQPEDRIVLTDDNNSVENYEAHQICEKTIGDFKNRRTLSLLKKALRKEHELADGSTYLSISVNDGKTGELKYSVSIDYGTRSKSAEKLISLLYEECGL